ncbi:MAG: hypothetical protein KKA65_00225 [Nanoarchaeota archaeon]|nr:hypothetical protein [Nanoarchaeota archaeon]MBU4242266.1 hypothetical protein [Nanoarchaeota archaeon]MBU4352182.1 hypothetical protein [Nanoarchaeota archaeon]MBU4455911.1 hypothetical protein [Nanoarchaeota archaeon]MCG2719894.1 hypothetical protein [Nanoarchaeota archaeon]
MADFEEMAIQIVDPFKHLWNQFWEIMPSILLALLLLLAGYLIAFLLGRFVKLILSKLKVDSVLSKVDAPKSISKMNISAILGQLTKWGIFIIFLVSAAEVLKLGALSDLLSKFVIWLPQLIVAILSVFLGLIVAYYVAHIIEKETNIKGAKQMAVLFKAIVIFIAVMIALEQVGLQVSILENTFLILVAGLSLGLAISLGISFGHNLKEPVGKFIANLKKK